MDNDETHRLLNIISSLDNRIVSEAMVETWATVLSGTKFDDALDRMGKFFRSGATRRLAVQDVVTPDEKVDENAWMDRSVHAHQPQSHAASEGKRQQYPNE
jgi:hypothetical protein